MAFHIKRARLVIHANIQLVQNNELLLRCKVIVSSLLQHCCLPCTLVVPWLVEIRRTILGRLSIDLSTGLYEDLLAQIDDFSIQPVL